MTDDRTVFWTERGERTETYHSLLACAKKGGNELTAAPESEARAKGLHPCDGCTSEGEEIVTDGSRAIDSGVIQYVGTCTRCDRRVVTTLPYPADSTAHGPPETWARCGECGTPVPVDRKPADAEGVTAT